MQAGSSVQNGTQVGIFTTPSQISIFCGPLGAMNKTKCYPLMCAVIQSYI